jgi:hypothetical protein
MIKGGADYHFPFIYPDAGFANIVYLLRVRNALFYDQTYVNDFFQNGNTFKADFRSTGVKVYFDTKWWNELPLTFGIRYSRLLDTNFLENQKETACRLFYQLICCSNNCLFNLFISCWLVQSFPLRF